ncbi:MAG: hypothetical protein ACKVOO_02780 [Burkholderiaceae bacterium]
MKMQALIAAFSLALAGAAIAQTTPPADPNATPRLDQRQVNQQQRIDKGVASGSLTQQEVDNANARQTNIANAETKAKADGTVTARERARLQHKQNKSSRAIKRNKRDGQVAG